MYNLSCVWAIAFLALLSRCGLAQPFSGYNSTNSSTASTSSSSCVGNCITSVPGCDVRGPLTQTGVVTITNAVGSLIPIPCPYYISIWSSIEASKQNTTSTNPTTSPINASPTVASPTITEGPASTSACIGNCITSVPGCDVRGPTTQTGMVTITDVGGKLIPVPCFVYISLWNEAQGTQTNTALVNATTTSPTSSTSSCVGNCITSVPGCDVRGPTTQTGIVTITDAEGALVPVPCYAYISIWNSIEASKSNTSTSLNYPNTTTTSSVGYTNITTAALPSYPHFVYDYKTTNIGSCDLFGALCQTGTIEASVTYNGTTSTTTVACSDYLSAQKSKYQSMHPFEVISNADEFALSFGRSPQCSTFVRLSQQSAALDGATRTYPPNSYYDAAYYSSVQLEDYSLAGYSLSGTVQIAPKPTLLAGCPANASVFDPSLYPAAVHHSAGAGHTWDCCGWCLLRVPELQVFYWPDQVSNSSSGLNTTNSTNPNASSKSQGAVKRVPSGSSGANTAVVDGYTYTSPSIYISIVGAATVSDFCGIIGPVPTGPVVPITGQLFTASYDYKLGEIWSGEGAGRSGTTKIIDFADFANPTWGLSNEFVTSYIDPFDNRPTVDKVRTIGPPFNPIVVPPPELLSYEPAWSVCSTFGGQSGRIGGNYFNAPLTYGIFDPPRALSSVSALGPPEVPNSPLPVISKPTSGPDPPPSKNDPAPATQPAAPTPKPTAPGDPPQPPQGSQQPAPGNPQQPAPGNPQQPAPGNPPQPPQGSQQPAAGDPQQPAPGNPQQPAPGNPQQPAPGNPQQPAPGNPQQPAPGNPQQPAPGNNQPIPGDPQQTPAGNTGLGGIILSGFGPVPTQGPSASKTTISIAPPAQPNPVITAGGQPITVLNPSVVAVGGTVVSANGPAATVGGQVISLDPNRGVIVGNVNGGGNGGGNGVVNGGANGGGNGVVSGGGSGGGNGGGQGGSNGGSGSPVAPVPLPPVGQGNHVISAGNSQLLTIINPSAVAVGGTVLSLNGPAATIGGQVFSFDPSAGVVVGATPSGAAPVIADNTAIVNPSNVIVAGSTLTPGGPGITISGTSLSLASSGILMVGGSTTNLAAQQMPSQQGYGYTVGGQVFTAAPLATAITLGGKTLSPGGPGITIGGTPISLAPSGVLVIDSSSINLGGAYPTSVFTAGGQVFTASPSGFTVAGTTIRPGAPGVTISGTAISLSPNGVLQIGTSIITPAPTAMPSVYTVGGQVFTANANGFSIASTSLTPGGPAITISGTVVSLETGGTLDIGTSKIPLGQSSVFTVGGQVFTANPSGFSIGGTTLIPGGAAVTISGTVISLEPGGTLDIGTSKIPLATGTRPLATGTGPLAFQGRGRRVEVSGLMLSMVGIMMAGIGGGWF